MESIAVTKPDIRIERQESLSPFGFLNRVFAEELIRRNSQDIGYYRPMRLAYLEEAEEPKTPPEIHFDLDVDLIVNRLLKAEKGRDEKKREEKKTPAQRILERVILREKEIRTAYPETRRLVIESAGRRVIAEVPVGEREKAAIPARTGGASPEGGAKARQDGEGRSTGKAVLLRPSASLARFAPVSAAASAAGQAVRERKMPLASQAMSVPAAGGWVPTEREVHPGYPGSPAIAKAPAVSAGSILLPDVMRRRREEALARQERADAPAAGSLAEEGLSWLTEGAEETPETEWVFRELRKAVTDTIRRNRAQAGSPRETPERAAAPEPPEGYAAPPLRQGETKNGTDRRTQAPAGMKNAPQEREHPEMPPADRIAAPEERDRSLVPQNDREEEMLSPGAATSRRAEGPGVPAASMEAPGETERAVPASVPSEAEVETSAPAALVYLEEDSPEPALPQGERVLSKQHEREAALSRPPAGTPVREGTSALPARETAFPIGDEETVSSAAAGKGPASAGEETARPSALPAEEKMTAASAPEGRDSLRQEAERAYLPTAPAAEGEKREAPAELVYREEQEAAAPEAAAQRPREDKRAFVAPAGVVPIKAEVSQPAVLSKEGQTPAPFVPEGRDEPRQGTEHAPLPTALPAEGEKREAPAALAYREEKETAAPEAAAQRPREEKRAFDALAGVVQKAETPRPASSYEEGQAPAASLPANRTELREAAEQEGVPTALPAEGEKREAPAALVYREEKEAVPEAAALRLREEKQTSGTPAGVLQVKTEAPRPTVPSKEKQAPASFAAEGRDGLRQGTEHAPLPTVLPAEAATGEARPPREQTPLPTERVSPEADAVKQALPVSVPNEAAIEAVSPPALVYREDTEAEPAAPAGPEREAKAPVHPEETRRERAETRRERAETGPSRSPAAGETGQAPAAAETILRGKESPAAGIPAALPQEAQRPGVRTELIYLEREAEAPAAQESLNERGPGTAGTDIKPSGMALPRAAGAADRGTSGEKAGHEAAETPEGEQAKTGLVAALPAEGAGPASQPAELRYLASPEQAVEAPISPPLQKEGEPRTGGTPASDLEPAEGKSLPGPAPSYEEREGAATAIPASPAAQETAPAALVYREGAEEGRARTAERPPAADTGSAAARTPVTQRQAASPRGAAERAEGRAAAPDGRAAEAGQHMQDVPLALPMEEAAQPAEQAALVYREEGPAERPQEGESPAWPGEQRAETPLYPSGSPEERAEESMTAILPAPQAEETALPPVGLQLRTEGEPPTGGVMGRAARDIRVTSEKGALARLAADRARKQGSTQPRAAGLRFPQETERLAKASPGPEAELPEPTDLVFAPLAQIGETRPPEAPARPTQKAEDNRTGSLPNWAKELLDKAGVTDTAQQAVAFSGSGAAAGRQISWTAPKQSTPAAQPVELSFKERNGQEETAAEPRFSDAEIRRTADKVYRIIEERLRRELRRSGR
ncbi:MAG: hypothetical protein IKD79_03920 [Oscillospiraceae bacterium]|nr:hypothetical protein [Oscillospiraceae bacterium]